VLCFQGYQPPGAFVTAGVYTHRSDNPMGLTNPRDDNPSFPGKHTNQQTKQPSANKSIHRGNIAIQNKHTNIVGK